jgi:hypothetical protein
MWTQNYYSPVAKELVPSIQKYQNVFCEAPLEKINHLSRAEASTSPSLILSPGENKYDSSLPLRSREDTRGVEDATHRRRAHY